MDHNSQLATGGYTSQENQLAGLVEAATAAAEDVSDWAAAAAAAAAAGHHQHLEGYAPDLQLGEDSFGDGGFSAMAASGSGNTGRQLRGNNSSNGQGTHASGLSRAVSKKRKRGVDALDPALAGAGASGGTGMNPQSQHHYNAEELDIRELPPQQSLSDARAAGVHSAAALFRQPSSNKKYTRPPMSKLFSSLELSPENFLHLQAAAKVYMLDENHPERRDCVGQRGKGDAEMVKLRLWNCVRTFLEQEGNGERFFGEDVVNEGMPPRQYIWPRDQQKIISLVIPLLRRMVTNERQRQYAIETRKPGGQEERQRRKTEEGFSQLGDSYQDESSIHDAQQKDRIGQTDNQQHVQFAPPLPTPHLESFDPNIGIRLSDVVEDGYPTDWDSISRSYNQYNQDYQLDNLWSISGLQQPDWWGLFAAVDSHYQIFHHGQADCIKQCEEANVNRILSSDSASNAQWRIGGGDNDDIRNAFASSITRDMSRIIRDGIGKKGHAGDGKDFHADQAGQPQLGAHQQHHGHKQHTATNNNHSQPSSITLHFNIVQNGKRILPRFDIPAEQCPDLQTARQLVARRFAGQLPDILANSYDEATGAWDPSTWRFKVWLPEGLVLVQDDGEWTIAQLSTSSIDWMDGDLRVVLEV